MKLQDRVSSKGLRKRLGLDDIISVLQQNRLWWYGHVTRKEDDDWVKNCMKYEVKGARLRGRPKKTWREIVEKDCQACKLNREDAINRNRWMKQIRDDWWPWQVWVGECFFWYRFTRVIPDKIQRAIKQLCVCVLTMLWNCSVLVYYVNSVQMIWNYYTTLHSFNGLFSRTTRVSRHQKAEPETVSGNGINWVICKSASRSRQIPCQCDERPSHPQVIMGIPKYWTEDWRSRWDELGRCGVRQWTWDVPGTHSARKL